MHRKYGSWSCLLAAGLFLLPFCGGCAGLQRSQQAEEISEHPAQMQEEQMTEKTQLSEHTERKEWQAASAGEKQAHELENAYADILESSTEEWAEGYPVDESFLEWLSEEFGSECVLSLAESFAAGEKDTEIWHDLTGNTLHVLWLLYCEQTGFSGGQSERVKWQECASDSEATFAFTGDINFSEGYVTTNRLDGCPNGIYDCFSEDLLELMRGIDVMMINNEFTYSARGEPLKGKTYTFRADPSRAKLLHEFGTDIVNLANNHVYDFGEEALVDTFAALDGEGIPYVGAGANLEEASRPYYFVCNGRKIAIVAATQIERSTNYTKEATQERPGVLKTLQPDKFVEVIRQAKSNSDSVIAVVHWGTEGDSYFGQDQKELADAFAAAGADAVIGGHTHCLQGFEMIGEVPVIYSLGNFWFSSNTLDTGIAKVTVDQEGELTLSFVPCLQKNLRTSLVTDEAERQRIFTFMQEHSADGTLVTEDGVVRQQE